MLIKGVFHFLDLWQGEAMRIYFEIGETQKSKSFLSLNLKQFIRRPKII